MTVSVEHSAPADIFVGWAFLITKAHWPAFNIRRVDRVDRARTKQLREKLRGEGVTDKIALARAVILRKAWVQFTDGDFDFHDGDLFHGANSHESLQVIAALGELLEVHYGGLQAYDLTPAQLVSWLKTGEIPAHCRIDKNMSRSEVRKYLLAR